MVAWESYGQDGDKNGIYGQRYDALGSPTGSEFQVNSYTLESQSQPSIVELANGDLAVAWQSSGQDGSGNGIFAQRFSLPAITGGPGNDALLGGTGDDLLRGNAGDDLIGGGLGTDVALYDGGYADYDVSVAADGTVTVIDQVGSEGTDTVTDVEELRFANLTFAVGGTTILPHTVADNASTNEDTAVTILADDLLANDMDIDGGTLSLISVDSAVNGSVALDVNGDVEFTPGADFNGPATFDYTVSDGNGGMATQTVAVDVTAVNDAPVAVADNTASTNEDTAVVILASTLLANDMDVDGDALTLSSVGGAVNGTVALDVNGDVEFTPGADFNGPATFDYTVSDGNGGMATQTVAVDVTAVNDAPVAVADNTASTNEDTAVVILASTLLANDMDVDGDALTLSSVGGAVNGTVALDVNGDVEFTPGADFNGPATFDYTVSDGNGGMATQTVAVDVTAVNDAPVAVADNTASTNEDTAVVILASTLLANDMDVDGDALTLSSVGGAVNGTVALDVNGDVEFTPGADFNGPATFDYTVSDGNGGMATQTVAVDVTAVNDAPVAVADNTASTNEDTAVVILASTLLANDMDVDGDALTLSSVGGAVNGTVALDVNGDVVFTPGADFNGPAAFDSTVSDGNGGMATQTVAVDVAAVNDAPVAGAEAFGTGVDTPVTVATADLLANDTDIDGDTLTLTSVGNAVNGTAALDVNGDVVFTPTGGFQGGANFDYTIDDGQGGTATQTVSVNVRINTAPIAVADAASTNEDTAVIILASTLLANDTDTEGDTLSLTSVGNAVNGSVALDVNGDVEFTPGADFNGQATFEYTIDDGYGGMTTQTVMVDVTSVNDAPLVSGPVLLTVAEDTSLLITQAELLGTASDVDGDALSVSGILADSGTLTDNLDGTWTLTPAADFNGTVNLTYDVSDGTALPVATTATVDVTAVNDAPVVSGPVVLAVAEDTSLVITQAELLGTASDVDGDVLSVSGVLADSGTLTDNLDGTWTLTPAADFNGTVNLTYEVSDGTALPVAATATVDVTALNDAPVVSGPVVLAVAEDTSLLITQAELLGAASDVDGDALSVSGVLADSGTLTDNLDGTWTLTPAADFNGMVNLTYEVSDGTALPVAATATINVTAVNEADSTGRRNTFSLTGLQALVQSFGGSSPSEGLAGPCIERVSNNCEYVRTVCAQIGSFREVLSKQSIGVLVRSALPRAVRFAEVDGKAGCDPQIRMPGHLCSLVPGQRAAKLRWQCRDRPGDGIANRFSPMTGKRRPVLHARDGAVAFHSGKMQQHCEPRGAFHQSADRRSAQADDQVTFPVSGYGPISCFRRSFTDHDLRRDEGFAPPAATCPRHAQCPSRAKAGGQLTTECAAALYVERLIDRLMTDPHRLILGPVPRIVDPKTVRDLLRTPGPGPSPVLPRPMPTTVPDDAWPLDHRSIRCRDPTRKPILHIAPQRLIRCQLGWLRPFGGSISMPLRRRCSVVQATASGRRVAPHLAGDRRRCSLQPASNMTYASSLGAQKSNLLTFLERQVTS